MQSELNGIIVLDKPANITSARAVAIVKKLLGVRKAGHTGTLDPFATGILICCINNATKLARFFLHDNKKYDAVLCLGIATDTQDFTGTTISTCNEIEFSEKIIRSVFKQFEGTIEQFPPIYSALKHKGVPLYKLARSGKPVQKPGRRIHISYNKIVEINLPLIRFEVSCSSGTYIRTLCADIGKTLGCGGHLKELRRIESSGFTLKKAVTLSELKELALSKNLSKCMISMTNALSGMPEYIINKALTKKIKHGIMMTKHDIMPEQAESMEGFIKIVDINNNLLAILNTKKESNKCDYCCVFNN